MTIGTPCDSCIVCVLRTCTCTVAGVTKLLLPIVPANVLASTTVVAIAMPFHSRAVWAAKFVPVTLIIVVCDPAAMVCGRTCVIFGFAAGVGVVSSWIVLGPHPSPETRRDKTALVANVFKAWPKIHPSSDCLATEKTRYKQICYSLVDHRKWLLQVLNMTESSTFIGARQDVSYL